MISTQHWDALLAADQLNKEKNGKRTFCDFSEGRITFVSFSLYCSFLFYSFLPIDMNEEVKQSGVRRFGKFFYCNLSRNFRMFLLTVIEFFGKLYILINLLNMNIDALILSRQGEYFYHT